MIVLEIKKPVPEVPPHREGFLHRITTYAQSRGHTPTSPAIRHMEKSSFIKFIEEEVKPNFKVGQLCTTRGLPFFPNRIPDPLWRIEEITEVTWMAPMDENLNQPRCLLVCSFKSGIYAPLPPKAVRLLNDEELAIVSLRNQEKQNREDATVQGPDQGLEPSLDNSADYAG